MLIKNNQEFIGRVAIITKKEVFYYSDYLNLFEKNKDILMSIKGKSIGLLKLSSIDIAKILPLLVGWVKSIVFIPSNVTQSDLDVIGIGRYIDSYLAFTDGQWCLVEEKNKTKNFDSEELYNTEIVIPTSGTTATPKLVRHSLDSLTRTVKSNTSIGGNSRWALSYQLDRFAGLQVFLQSYLSGSSIVIPDGIDEFRNKLKFFGENKCTCMSATPTFWRMAIMYGVKRLIPQLKIITLGGEISNQEILDKLKNIYPTSKITHIYASTEAGVGFSVSDGFAGFPISYMRNGLNKIKLDVSESSTLLIKNSCSSQSYVGRDDLVNSEGFIDSGDIIKVTENRVYFLGRCSGAINVGGNKVMPEEVESVLLGNLNVKLCRVYAKKNSIMGSLVCCDISFYENGNNIGEMKKDLIEYCKARLDDFKIPVIYRVVDEVEIRVNDNGKMIRQ
ncbi:AMP-binding protein [Aeromonas piscicola]|uniref:AMP-binding protein n=1 Tax=Aeromonas piscicola TaxID=600645 RepID=UPI0028E95F74|nr:AMP-binding protein [Aeromonas piscicola]